MSTKGFASQRRIAAAKAKEFSVISAFPHGYRNREDITNLPPDTLVVGSQNVLTDVSGRVGIRRGYTEDDITTDAGTAYGVGAVVSAFDWPRHTGDVVHVRSGGLTSAGNNGTLQFRYTDTSSVAFGANAPVWISLLTGLNSVSFNYSNFWDFSTELKDLLLMVNGTRNVYEWSGAVAQYASATINTLTISGTKTAGQLGFYSNGTRGFTIVLDNGQHQKFTYSGGEGTMTLTGVAPDPTAFTITAGAPVFQTPRVTANGSLTGLPNADPWTNDLISNLKNQIYIGCKIQNSVYISKVNNYKDYSFTTPVRVVGEGARIDLDGPAVGLIPQEDQMYMTAGKDQWYLTQFTLSSDLAKESLTVNRLKTVANQAAQSQSLITKIRDNVVFVSNEPIITSLGRVSNVVLTPQMTDLSHSIINDMTAYNFSGGCAFYWQNYLLVAVPAQGVVRIFNMTEPKNTYWEAPQLLPFSCFSIIDGNLYGHSAQTLNSFKMFDGYNDDGHAISAVAAFAFDSHKIRPTSKGFNMYFIEGYISSNSTLTLGLQYDLDGCATNTSFEISGQDTRIVCIGSDDNSLGKFGLGKQPLGGDLNQVNNNSLPPKFRAIKTFSKVPYYEYQVSFSSEGIDNNWSIIAFGPAWSPTSEGNNPITE